MDDLSFRSLAIQDKQQFLRALNALRQVSLSDSLYESILRDRQFSGTITVVAEFENEIVGTASYFIETKFLHEGGKVMHIEDVAVEKRSQKHGTGRALMLHLCEIAKSQNCYKVILNCSNENLGFYEKCGFYHHELEMRKDLK